jgi:hypothetical protein
MDSNDKREALIGHTALCLMSLLGFLLYTATYSVVYMIKTEGKPIAILEMWMVLTHLLLSVLSCALRMLGANTNNNIAETQSAIFLAVSLILSSLGTACMQDSLYCNIYYPAAALPSLAASGSMAWAWVMYLASLGCQSGASVSLGLDKRGAIYAAGIMGLVVPQVLSTLSTTCDTTKWKRLCSQGASCNTTVNVFLIFISIILSQIGHSIALFEMKMIGIILQISSVAFIWIDILAVISVGQTNSMAIYIGCMTVLSIVPVIDIIYTITKPNIISTSPRHHQSNVNKTGLRFPHLNLYNNNLYNMNMAREHDL